jgi:DNA replication protein DnaC
MKKETRQEVVPCQTCPKAFMAEVTVYYLLGRVREVRPKECPACRQDREASEKRLAEEERQLGLSTSRARWRRTCGIPEYMQDKNFDNFIPHLQRVVFKGVQKWVETFCENPKRCPSLILWSEGYGVGKTHLAVAACNKIIESWEGRMCPVRFESGPGLVRRIRATYNPVPGQEPYHETEEMVYAQLRGVPLLVLDDVGKEKSSPHTREVYFYIIDERLKQGLPVLITSNLPLEGTGSLEELTGASVVSRLIGMCRGGVFELKGADARRREKRP